VIQADQLDELGTVTIRPVTSTVIEAALFRITVQPSGSNGLRKASQVVADKAITVKRDKVGSVVGRIEAEALVAVERCLAVFLGIAK
jgi:mRNA interferase MazF